MTSTERGQFRSIEMSDLEQLRNDPRFDNEETEFKYFYPVRISRTAARREGERLAVGNPPDETYRFGPFVCATSPHSHVAQFKHAVDFLVPDGTPVVAARAGRIIELQEHSDRWGTTPEFRDALNYLTLDHGDGEYSQYCHLAMDSVAKQKLWNGQQVKRGQQIATVGKTGWTDRDHLHFIVFRNIDAPDLAPPGKKAIKSLKIRFVNQWLQYFVQ